MKNHVLLICIVLSVCIVLGILTLIAFKNSHISFMIQTPTPIPQQNSHINTLSPTPDLSFAVLSFTKNDAHSINVIIDTKNKDIDAVQLEIGFDPRVLSNVQFSPQDMLRDTLLLKETDDLQQGRIFYAAAVHPNKLMIRGKGILGTLTFSVIPGVEGITTVSFLPRTKLTSQGIEQSILHSATEITFPTPK